MQRIGGVVAAFLFLLIMTGTAFGGGYDHGDHTTTTKHDCPEGKEWNKYKKKCKPTTTTSSITTTIPDNTTTTTGETTTSLSVTTTSTSTTVPASTTTTVEASSTTVVTVPPSFEPGTFCEDGSTWLVVDFEVTAFSRIDVYLEDPRGTSESTFIAPGELKFGVLTSGTYFTFVGTLVEGGVVSQVLYVPATDCGVTPLPTVATTIPVDPPEELPFTGVEEKLVWLGLALFALGSIGVYATKTRGALD